MTEKLVASCMFAHVGYATTTPLTDWLTSFCSQIVKRWRQWCGLLLFSQKKRKEVVVAGYHRTFLVEESVYQRSICMSQETVLWLREVLSLSPSIKRQFQTSSSPSWCYIIKQDTDYRLFLALEERLLITFRWVIEWLQHILRINSFI